jgi:GNAT superfamily N-acetyltransferase
VIRRAEARDLPQMVEMGRAFHAEAGWPGLIEWDDAGAHASLAAMLDSEQSVMLVADDGERVCAMAAAVVCDVWFSPGQRSGQEWFWYVRPDARKGVGVLLLDALERAVKAKGAATFTMLAVSGLRAEALARVYRRRGYRPAEQTFMRRL